MFGAILSGAATIGSALIGADAADDAAKAAKDAAMKQWNLRKWALQPYLDLGRFGIGQTADEFNAQEYAAMYPDVVKGWKGGSLEDHYNLHGKAEGRKPNAGARGLKHLVEQGPGEFDPAKQPGYKFGYEQFIERPTTHAASALGQLRSGKTGKALTRYAQDYAGTHYDQWLNRYYQRLDPYFRMAGMGGNAANVLATGAPNYQQSQYDSQIQQGNALMAGIGGLSNIANRGIDWYNTWKQPGVSQPGVGWGQAGPGNPWNPGPGGNSLLWS